MRNCNLVAIFPLRIAILLQLIAIPKIEKPRISVFDPILMQVAIQYLKVATVAIVNVYTNVYKLLQYITKVANSYWDRRMSQNPRLGSVFWHTQETYILHYMYYNPCTFLQANDQPRKIAIVVSFFSNRGQIKQYSTLFKSCNFQNGVAIPVATVAIFVAIKLQLIAIPIKYSCYKNMCVKD